MVTEYTNICLICGKPKDHTHHLISGRGRRPLCDEDNLTVPLCWKCHDEIHLNNTSIALSKIVGQLVYEKDLVAKGIPPEMAREQFRRRYGESYL